MSRVTWSHLRTQYSTQSLPGSVHALSPYKALGWARGLSVIGTVLVSDRDLVSTTCPLLELHAVPVTFIICSQVAKLLTDYQGQRLRANPASFSHKAEGTQSWS